MVKTSDFDSENSGSSPGAAAKSVKLGFTGTRQGIFHRQSLRLSEVIQTIKPTWFIHGGAEGADFTANEIAKSLSVKTKIYPAKERYGFWKELGYYDQLAGSSPPLVRNEYIVNESNYMVATPGSYEEELRSGTWATIRYCRKLGTPLCIIWPDGTQQLEMWPGSLIPQFRGW